MPTEVQQFWVAGFCGLFERIESDSYIDDSLYSIRNLYLQLYHQSVVSRIVGSLKFALMYSLQIYSFVRHQHYSDIFDMLKKKMGSTFQFRYSLRLDIREICNCCLNPAVLLN